MMYIKEIIKKIFKVSWDGPYITFALFGKTFRYASRYRRIQFQIMQESVYIQKKIEKSETNILNKLIDYNQLMRGVEKSINTAFLHEKNLYPYKNICQNKDIVICGSGPSLKSYKPISNAVHIALNRTFLWNEVNFDYIIVHDYKGIDDWKDELKEYRQGQCVKFFGITRWKREREISESYAIECNAVRFYTDGYTGSNDFAFDLSSSPVGSFNSVALAAMQIALYMNPKTIYIVGCDSVPNGHFDGVETVTNKIESTKENYDCVVHQWEKAKEFASIFYPDTKIISINPKGLKGLFEDIYYE